MTNDQKRNEVGDKIAPGLRQSSDQLANSANGKVNSPVASIKDAGSSSKAQSVVTCVGQITPLNPKNICTQTIWFSFFFDGTGNNLNADVETLKHSNVAKLYRAHRGDENNGGDESRNSTEDSFGLYRIYVPGVGTYFRAVGDDGGSTRGLAFGDYGSNRLDWALKSSNLKWNLISHLHAIRGMRSWR